MREMIVHAVIKEHDRTLIYDKPNWYRRGYHVIDSKASSVKVGDVIEYETYGMNFGWFVRVIGEVVNNQSESVLEQ